jgi:hypothetical protein
MSKIVQAGKPIEVEYSFVPHNEAILAALRVVLDLPRTPTILQEEEK